MFVNKNNEKCTVVAKYEVFADVNGRKWDATFYSRIADLNLIILDWMTDYLTNENVDWVETGEETRLKHIENFKNLGF